MLVWLLRGLAVASFLLTPIWLLAYFAGRTSEITLALVFATLFGLFLTEGERVRYRRAERSRFFLDSAVSGFRESSKLLSNRNNERTTWILAARILARARSVSQKVTEPEHREILSMETDRYRNAFARSLGSGDPCVTGAFFYGSPHADEPIEQAARNVKLGRAPVPVQEIDEAALYEIWSFAEYPSDYGDPIGSRFGKSEVERVKLRYPGLHRFLVHKGAEQRRDGPDADS